MHHRHLAVLQPVAARIMAQLALIISMFLEHMAHQKAAMNTNPLLRTYTKLEFKCLLDIRNCFMGLHP